MLKIHALQAAKRKATAALEANNEEAEEDERKENEVEELECDEEAERPRKKGTGGKEGAGRGGHSMN